MFVEWLIHFEDSISTNDISFKIPLDFLFSFTKNISEFFGEVFKIFEII
jgi:hypothetical protein